jgi:hypothetical protein
MNIQNFESRTPRQIRVLAAGDREKRRLAISRLFSMRRSFVILSLEHWRKVSLFPSGSNYSQLPVFPGL